MASYQSETKKTTNNNPSMSRTKTGGIQPSEEQIRTRAYHLWQARGCDHGQECNDWYEAEKQLMIANLKK